MASVESHKRIVQPRKVIPEVTETTYTIYLSEDEMARLIAIVGAVHVGDNGNLYNTLYDSAPDLHWPNNRKYVYEGSLRLKEQ